MSNENPEIINKLIKPEDVLASNDDVIRQLSENLQGISADDINSMCVEIDKLNKEKEWKITQELLDYRETWIKEVHMKDDIKTGIIKASENIPVKVEIDGDGSRLIEFKLGGKTWKIFDPKLETHTDEEYRLRVRDNLIDEYCVKLGGMWGDDIESWKNQKLKEYVKEKQIEGLHIPKIEEMTNFLGELGKQINSDELGDQIAMLMYLTGMNGIYWFSMGDSLKSGIRNMRTILYSSLSYFRCIGSEYSGDDRAGLCMISSE